MLVVGIVLSIFLIVIGVYKWKWAYTLDRSSIAWQLGWHNARKFYVFLGTSTLALSIAGILADILSIEFTPNAPPLIALGILPAYYFSDTLSRHRNNLSLLEFFMSEEEKDEDDE